MSQFSALIKVHRLSDSLAKESGRGKLDETLYLIRDSQVLDGTASDEALWHLPESVTILGQEREQPRLTVPTL